MKQTLFSALVLFATLLVSTTSQAQTTGSNYTAKQAQELLERHNFHRQQVSTPPLKWSNDLAQDAQQWAEQIAQRCQMEHSQDNSYGENIFWGTGNYSSAYIVDSWASEAQYYKGQRISYSNYSKFGHYTQIIWYNTTEVGCGYATCKNGATMVVCRYNPPGNYIGQRATGN